MRYINTERLGIIATDKIVTKDIGWIFREQSICDVGIDAIIEQVEDNNPKGRFIALQIKSGEGNFHFSDDKLIYYVSNIHYNYWLNLNIPVLLIAHLPLKEETYWSIIDESTLKKTKSKWKIEISTNRKFNLDLKQELIEILSPQTKRTYNFYKTILDNKSAQYNLLTEKIENLYIDSNSDGNFQFLSRLNIEKLASEVAGAINELIGSKITMSIIEYSFASDSIHSLWSVKNEHIEIVVNGKLNKCWKNFSTIHSLIETYFNLGELSLSDKKENNFLDAIKKAIEKNIEMDEAFINAVNVIIAPKDRKLVYEIGRTLIDDPSRPFTNYDLARFYQVPEFIIKYYREKIEKAFFGLDIQRENS